MKLQIKKLTPIAVTPTYATQGSAAFDISAASVPYEGLVVHADNPQIIGTDLSFKVPDGHVMLVFSRSGHGFKNNVRLANCVGVIDSDYTGELKVKLAIDANDTGFTVHNGDRIAQGMIVPIVQAEFDEVKDLPVTERGDKGFGSTGT